MTPRQLWERMKARMAEERRKDLRTGHVSSSIYKAIRGSSVRVEPEDFVMGPRERPKRSTWQEQQQTLQLLLSGFKRDEHGQNAA